MKNKARVFWPLLLGLLVADCGTKRMAEESLALHTPHSVFGDVLRFTLAYNPGAAFGIDVGPASRTVFTVLALLALVALFAMYRSTPPEHRVQVAALGLITGGALGNLYDRLRGAAGVVDFIDVGLGGVRFWTFNIADAGITIGAILLAVTLWAEPEPEPGSARQPAVDRSGDKAASGGGGPALD